ncbi:MAG TPA: hypothetical protein VHY31_17045 [Streptosporangiaceae bacterium]|nr:hypothetical protein [Streptosporangiaceae bacterium]
MPDSTASNPETEGQAAAAADVTATSDAAGAGGASGVGGAADAAGVNDAAALNDAAVDNAAVDDTVRRLRAAMKDAVAGEHPPANLLSQVRARRRRHRARTALVSAAVVVIGVLVFPPAAAQLRDASPPGGGPAAARPPAPLPRAAPGTVLKPCNLQISEQLPLDWRRESVQAGPVWFVNMKQATASFYPKHKLAIGGLLVQVRSGVTASVKVVGPASGHFRFLFGPGDSIKGVDSRYTLKDGENGVTFGDCPASGEASFVSGYTQFGGYFLIDKIPQRVTLEVQAVGGGRPVRVTLLVGY